MSLALFHGYEYPMKNMGTMNVRTVGMWSLADARKWSTSTDTCMSDRRIGNAAA